MRKSYLTCLAIMLLLFALASTAFPFGSGEKSEEEKAAEREKKATKEYNKGVQHMDKAREKAMKGDSTYAFNYRATSEAKAQKEYEKAVKRFHKAIEYKEEFPEAYNNLGFCFRKLDKLKESLEAYNIALKQKPDFAQALEYLGETFLALDSLNGAQIQLKKLKELESTYADTLTKSIELYKLAQVQEKLNKSTE